MAAPAALSELEFRPAGPTDEPALTSLFLAARPALGFAGLDEAGLTHLVAMQRRAQDAGYAARWPRRRTEVICRDGVVVAMIMTAMDGDCLHVLDIAVDAAVRGQGVGTAALQRALAAGHPVELTVAIGNPAARLYERLGFAEVGRTDTDIVMRRPAPEPVSVPVRGRAT